MLARVVVCLVALGTIHTSFALSIAEAQPRAEVKLGQPVVVGDLDKAIVRRYIKRNLVKLQYCYELQLVTKPTAQGALTVMFTIAATGAVSGTTALGLASTCVIDVVRRIEFPRPHTGVVKVMYPMTFVIR